MAASALLVIDEITKSLVGQNTGVPRAFHPYTAQFKVQIVQTADEINTQNTIQDKSACSLRMILSSKPNAIPSPPEAVPVIYAEAAGADWTWDGTNLWFTGGLNLDTGPLRTKIRENSSVQLYLIILLTTDGVEDVIYGPSGEAPNITIQATPASSLATASAPTPAVDYYTTLESLQLFMQRNRANANFREKDGLLQFWSDYYYGLDNTKPWYTWVDDAEEGPRKSGPIST